MNIEIVLHASEFETEKPFLQAEIQKQLTQKLDKYILPHMREENQQVLLDATFERSKEGFNGKVILTLPDVTLRSSRENFNKLDDLVSHLFTHLKTQLSK